MTVEAEAYVEARRVLLDALGALAEHRDALVVVGALVAKGHKIHDRTDDVRSSRLHAKDAADVYRLAAATPRIDLVRGLGRLLSIAEAAEPTREGVEHVRALFGRRGAPGVRLATEALAGAVSEAQVAAVLTGLAADLPA